MEKRTPKTCRWLAWLLVWTMMGTPAALTWSPTRYWSSRIRKKSDSEKSRFLSIYSSIKAHMIWEQPYFKVRIGDFKTRLEAQKAMDLISKDFSSCYIVRDEILIKKTRVKEK
ncbi:MAG: SPOR domain-containing protein [Bacteroidetes bacterium]|nr:SPOR domain-containing protein [Bacteroidota bacterium]